MVVFKGASIVIHFTTIDIQVLKLVFISFVGTNVARGVVDVEESRSTRRKPMYPSGRPPFPITYNHCRSRGSNTGRECIIHYATWIPTTILGHLDTPIVVNVAAFYELINTLITWFKARSNVLVTMEHDRRFFMFWRLEEQDLLSW